MKAWASSSGPSQKELTMNIAASLVSSFLDVNLNLLPFGGAFSFFLWILFSAFYGREEFPHFPSSPEHENAHSDHKPFI